MSGETRPEVLCIIPARGGSKGIPRKNVRLLAGKPLLSHSIGHALQATSISRTVVSTDDDEIARVARDAGAEVVVRPANISGDTATSESALAHVLQHLADTETYVPDLVVFLQCTSPIRGRGDVDAAFAQLRAEGANSLLSAVRSHAFLWTKTETGAQAVNYDYRQRPRRQDRLAEYRENGSIYIFEAELFRNTHNRLGGKISLYEMNEWSSVDIDTEADFELCEWILEKDRNVD